jgi:hypothetical protein
MMKALLHDELMSLEEYHRNRAGFRQRVMAHKRPRRIALGAHLALYFEDRLTIQYQIQEMLRIERIFESQAIQEELDTYNPLIPDGDNLKATCMIEYPDEAERQRRLKELLDIENQIWVRVGDDGDPVFAIADEDLDRSTEDKTSAVHFLRFQLDTEQIAALKSGKALIAGVDHPAYQYQTRLEDESRNALIEDLE